MRNAIEFVSEFEKIVKESHKPVIVILIAKWCGTCQIMEPILENLANEYKEKIKFVMADIDVVKEVTANCRFDKLPILLFFKDGNLIDQLIGTMSYNALGMKVKNLLDNSSTNNFSGEK
jgi:thioredoxin 1